MEEEELKASVAPPLVQKVGAVGAYAAQLAHAIGSGRHFACAGYHIALGIHAQIHEGVREFFGAPLLFGIAACQQIPQIRQGIQRRRLHRVRAIKAGEFIFRRKGQGAIIAAHRQHIGIAVRILYQPGGLVKEIVGKQVGIRRFPDRLQAAGAVRY